MTSTPAEILGAAAKQLLEVRWPDMARKLAELALAEEASCANAHSILAVTLDEMAEWRQGLAHARRAAELYPDAAQLKYNLARSTLRLDDYRNGFALGRRASTSPTGPAWPARLAAPPSATACCGLGSRSPDGAFWRSSSRGWATASCSHASCRCWHSKARGSR